MINLRDIDFVELGVIDPDGRLKTRTFPAKSAYEVLKDGFGFDGSSIGFVGVEDSDMLAKPDLSSVKVFTHCGHKIAFFMCDVFKDDKPFKLYPRILLKEILEKLGFNVFVGPEIEFYVKKNNYRGNREYMNPYPLDEHKPIKRELMKKLDSMGFEVKVEHHEVGDGQHELVFKFDSPLVVADKITFCKYFLRIFFAEKGIEITFMPKPFFGMAGNGMHCHFSLWKNEKPVLFEKSCVTEMGLNFIGGILKEIKGITITLNSCVNSFKRLVPGYEAPCYVCWGYGNRSALIRIPKYTKNKINRIEIRSPDPLCNPYLAFASILLAGIKGIRKKVKPTEPININVYELKKGEVETLPKNLHESIKFAEKSEILKDLLGNELKRFLDRKRKEWEEYIEFLRRNKIPRNTVKVTEWEVKRYFYA